MAERFLRIIKQFSPSDLSEFLHTNGRRDFKEILFNGEINNGEKFLNLTELQMIKWKIPLATKRKILLFLTEIKENPQNFLEKKHTEKYAALSRRQSLHTDNGFREKLEQVIIMPKPPTEPKPIKEPALPTRPAREIEQPLPSPSPPEEYLPMDLGKVVNPQAHYDDSGYLIPIEASKEHKEDTYEPSPSEKIITNFASGTYPRVQPMFQRQSSNSGTYPRAVPISLRAPLALPRNSSDERGYIRGPEDLAPSDNRPTENPPALFPRVAQRNQRNIPFKPPIRTPSPSRSSQFPKALEESESDEEVDYEPIDEEHDAPSRVSPELNADNQTRSFSRLLGFLKINKKPDLPKSEPIEIATNSLDRKQTSKSSSPSGRSPSIRSHSPKYTSRPLPPLPTSPGNVKSPDTEAFNDEPLEEYENVERRKRSRARKVDESEEPLEAYENIEKDKKSTTPEVQDDEPLEAYENVQKRPSTENTQTRTRAASPKTSSKSEKSKSENNLAEEEAVSYGNIEEKKKPKYPESYEEYVGKSKFGKRPLPLPPPSLPQIKLDDEFLPKMDEDHEDEIEEYGQYLFNLNDEPFYRNTDRKGARLLLEDLGDGAFLFRPSRKFFLTISLKYHGRCFNLGIEKTHNNKIRLNTSGSSMSPEFATLTNFVEHFTLEQLTFEHQGVVIETYLRTSLPRDRF